MFLFSLVDFLAMCGVLSYLLLIGKLLQHMDRSIDLTAGRALPITITFLGLLMKMYKLLLAALRAVALLLGFVMIIHMYTFHIFKFINFLRLSVSTSPAVGRGVCFGQNNFEIHFSKMRWATRPPNVLLISDDGAADCNRFKRYLFSINRRTSSAFRVFTSQVRQFDAFGICVFSGGRCRRINSPSFCPISSVISSMLVFCA